MATVQLVAVRPTVATVQVGDDPPSEITWSLLHAAQDQADDVGYVYRWLLHEFCRCEYLHRLGQAWHSPRRDVVEIIAELQAEDTRKSAEAEAARKKKHEAEVAADRRRKRDEEIRRVETERQQTAADDPWWPIPWWEVPEAIRFDTPGRNQGQIVEVSFGTFGRAEADRSDPYMHVFDRSDKTSRFYKRRAE